MTDITYRSAQAPDLHTSADAHGRLKARYRREGIFKYLGLSAVGISVLFLLVLLYTIIGNGYLAFTFNYVNLPVQLEKTVLDPKGNGDLDEIGRADFSAVARQAMSTLFPHVSGRQEKRVLNGLLTSDAGIQIRKAVLDNPALIGGTVSIPVQLDDVGDLYFKDQVTPREVLETSGAATPSGLEGSIEISSTADDFTRLVAAVRDNLLDKAQALRLTISAKKRSEQRLASEVDVLDARVKAAEGDEKERLQARLRDLQLALSGVQNEISEAKAQVEILEQSIAVKGGEEAVSRRVPSFLININGGVVKINSIGNGRVSGDVLIPLQSTASAKNGDWSLVMLNKPEDNRKLSDREIVFLDHLKQQGLIEEKFNSVFFTTGASREAEQAGIFGAVMGSLYTMLVTLLLSFPIGVAAAIYLEEFAPKNRTTWLIEVNINNLAAVPSIIFGLLGLAMFLNIFGMPRSAPVVGGMVLALMTLPTIIIAGRAALRSVPPSIREAALGIGASKLQAVLHHVLPLAMPGILTGTIIGMAQALGETAPLLMIGMVAFIVDVPGSPFDPSTVLPVQIYMWADFPEQAFQQKTSAAILVLLAFLVAMNAIAVVLRKRFERRW